MAKDTYRPLGGSSRRYENTRTGETISRRQYQKLSEGKSFEQKRAERQAIGVTNPMARYNKIKQDFINQKLKEGMKREDIKVKGNNKTSNELKKIVKDLKSKDNSPTGKKAKALEALGRRDPEWANPVGESP